MRAVVYDRTSGDESSTGQDPKAQLAVTVGLAEREGFEAVGAFNDPDVKGDVDWEWRAGFEDAAQLLIAEGNAGRPCVLFVREVSRLWRGVPEEGLGLLARVNDMTVYGDPVFERRGGVWTRDGDADHLMRFIALWQAWTEKRRLETRTQQKMTAFKEKTATPKGRVGRPPVVIEPAHIEAARAILERGGAMAEAYREVLRLRGYDDAKDPRTKKARYVSKASLGNALGLYSVKKADASETPSAPADGLSNLNGSLPDGVESGQNSVPVVSAGSTATGGAGRGQAVSDGGA
jgi:hypothetical protein